MDIKKVIEEANQKALQIITSSQPYWVNVFPAIEVIPGMKKNLFLHAGPPITWQRMCSAQKKAVCGAAVFEGLATTLEEANELGDQGEIIINSSHEHDTVGSMTGVTSASMPVIVVENRPYGNRAFINIHEGPSHNRLTYGSFDDQVCKNLEWIRDVLGPALGKAVQEMGGMAITPIIARALTMGDEVHNRPVAGSLMFAMKVMPYLIRSELDKMEVSRICEFLAATEHFFFHFAMAAHKAELEAASGIPYCSMVTAIARNGIEVGIRVSGTGNEWFTGPAAEIRGVYFPGFGPGDAELDIGDSAITETAGLGAFAMAASPSMALAVGGTAADAVRFQESMLDITISRHPVYQVPYLDFKGTPLGIDIRKVVQTNILPIIDTAIANKKGGEIGVGIARPPMDCFIKALKRFGETVKQAENE
jgi:hypothetical protein